jgi:hypothetical protein
MELRAGQVNGRVEHLRLTGARKRFALLSLLGRPRHAGIQSRIAAFENLQIPFSLPSLAVPGTCPHAAFCVRVRGAGP